MTRPLVEIIEHYVKQATFSSSSTVNGRFQDLFSRLLYGIPMQYSTPFPLLVDSESSKWTTFQKYMCQKLTHVYIAYCEQLVGLAPQLLTCSDIDVFEALFITNSLFNKLVYYPGFASGDMYGVSASMVLDTTLHVRFVTDGKLDRIDRSGSVRKFMSESVDLRRTSTVDIGTVDSRSYVPAFDTKKDQETRYLNWISADLWTIMESQNEYFCAVDLFFGTKFVALHFGRAKKASSRKLVRKSWDVHPPSWPRATAQTLVDFLKLKGFHENNHFPKKKKVAILWVRFTGKTGGAHVEYDTSFEGLRQLLIEAKRQGNDWAILVGDKPKFGASFGMSEKARRLSKITTIVQGSPIPTIDLTEFWSDSGWKADFTKRSDQFKLFEVLHYHNYVKHLGARSGNLEALALLGYQTCYFEQKEDPGKERMEVWHDTVGYKRIQIAQVPTRSGKYILAQGDMYPSWTFDKRIQTDMTRGKKWRKKMKPIEISRRLLDITYDTVEPIEDPMSDPLTLLRAIRTQPISLLSPKPRFVPRLLDIPSCAKGFSRTDLPKLGFYLRPDVNYKSRNPL